MRLKEEKTLIFLGILAALIIIFNMFQQFSASKITEFYNGVSQKQLTMLDNYINMMQVGDNLAWFRLYGGLKLDVTLGEANPSELPEKLKEHGYMNQDYIILDKKARGKEISSEQFIKEATNLYEKDYFKFYKIYIENKAAVLKDMNGKTPWFLWNSVLVVLQFVLIILNLLGYSYLFIQIKNRLQNT